MLFNSVEYAIFVALSVVAYYASPSQHFRQWVLLAASVAFYASWIPIYLLLLLFVVSANFAAALGAATGPKIVIAVIALDLAVLGFFKYSQFG